MKDAGLPITLIVVGVIWLVWRMGWFPDKDWLIGLGFIAGGVTVLVMDGITRNSVVTGPFLVAIGLAWLVRDQYRVSWSLILPLLLILLGALMLLARLPGIPESRKGKALTGTGG
jgi:hypothetical protein